MGLSMDTVKDLVGNVADDAKGALDDILEREPKHKGGEAAAGLGVPSAPAGSDLAGVSGGAAGGAVGSAAALGQLPGQITRLSEQIDALMQLLESVKEALPSLPDAPSRRTR